MKSVLGALLLGTCAATSAYAAMPVYEPSKYCERVASITGPRSEWLYGGCIDMEQSAYDGLKLQWDTMPIARQNWCDKIARVTGGSYWLLKGCIDMEIAAKGKQFQP
jgi:hypothetical protein